jgi:opacity protein-like surface antigen
MRVLKLISFAAPVAAILMVAGACGASADPYPQKRDGFYLGLGLGGGTGAVSLSGGGASLSSDRRGGAVGSLRFGWALHPQLSLGVESNAWARTENGATVSFSVATVGATYFPNPEQGIFLRAGVGGGSERLSASSGAVSASASQNGFGFTAGTGYEMRLTPHWTLGPALDFGYVSVDAFGGKVSANYVNFTAAMNWYFF